MGGQDVQSLSKYGTRVALSAGGYCVYISPWRSSVQGSISHPVVRD